MWSGCSGVRSPSGVPRFDGHLSAGFRRGPGRRMSNVSGNRGRRPYPPESKREAVELYRRSGKSLVVIVGELGIAHESLRQWNKQHAVDAGKQEGLTPAERDELRQLRR